MSSVTSTAPSESAGPNFTALVVAVPTGAAADTRQGTAHLVEHLILRRCYDPMAPWVINGLTSERVTLFECITRTDHLEAAQAMLNTAVLEPLLITPQEVDDELRVIDVEFSAERTSEEILGTLSTRAEISASDVMDFHTRHYRPAAVRNVVVSVGTSVKHEPGLPADPHHASLSPDDIHTRESDGLTQVVLTQSGRDADGAALLLNLARRFDPVLPRRLVLPVETGHKRLHVTGDGESLAVSIRLIVRPTVTALALTVAGGTNRTSRHSWIRERLCDRMKPVPYEWGDPVVQARWQAFWDLSVEGGYVRLHHALDRDPIRLENEVRLAASQIGQLMTGVHV